jgi:hypothetical protein
MGKKMETAEPKKECPSCGLGVTLDSTICEFCGWDFDEEDEWILQIEKLERDLMLEKQKFEPGTMNHMIESTLSSPVRNRHETALPTPPAHEEEHTPPPPPEHHDEPVQMPADDDRAKRVRTVKTPPAPPPVEEHRPPVRAAPQAHAKPVPQTVPTPRQEPTTRKLKERSPEPQDAPRTRTVRALKAGPKAPEQECAQDSDEAAAKRTRVVRKVKGA